MENSGYKNDKGQRAVGSFNDIGLYSSSVQSFACKNDNSAYLCFLIISPDQYFYCL